MTELNSRPKRTLVVGDIHGGYRALGEVLKKAQITSNDLIIFLGDYVDGWSESFEVVDFLIDFSKDQDCVFIRGNHEVLLLEWLMTGNEDPRWLKHGGLATIAAYKNKSKKEKEKHIQFIQNLENYYIDEKNRLFLHAGFTHLKGVKYEHFPAMTYWDRSLWETALSLNPNLKIDDLRYPERLKIYHEIFIGHTPTVRIGTTLPVKAANVWNLDTGAAFDGPLTILDVDTKEYWQSELVMTLYPTERSREVQ